MQQYNNDIRPWSDVDLKFNPKRPYLIFINFNQVTEKAKEFHQLFITFITEFFAMSSYDTTASGRLKKFATKAGFIQDRPVATKEPINLKKLASSSSWVSPFRTSESSKQHNLHKQLHESNKLDKITVPKRFQASSAPAPAPSAKLENGKPSESSVDEPNASTKSLKDEPINTPNPNASVNEVNEANEADDGEKSDAESERPLNEEELNADAKSEKEDVENGDASKAPESESVADGEAEKATESKSVAENGQIEKEPESVANGAKDDNIEQEVKETPIELVTQPEMKYEPVTAPNQEVLDQLKDKPKLLDRYEELNATAIGSVSRHLDDPNKVIDLGQGLKMSQQQILDIAAKRVAPVLANINEAVDKTRKDDELKREQLYDQKVEKHKSKLLGEFDKYVRKIGQKKEKYTKEIETKLAQVENDHNQANADAEEFETTTRKEIETANTEFEEREAKAVEKHANDKETLLKNHDELEATKKQELEEAKEGQVTTTQEIEELQEKKAALDDENSQLSTKIEELTAQLDEQTAQLDDLKGQHQTKTEEIANNKSNKEELDTKIASTKKDLENKRSKHAALSAEVGVLAGVLASYATKLTSLASDRDDQTKRLSQAKDKFKEWQNDKQQMADEIAKDHERQRLEAIHEAETKKHKEELERQAAKEEKERLEKEEAEERERKAKEEADELERLKKEKAEAEEKDELLRLKKEREEEERLKDDPEHQRELRIAQRNLEQQRLMEEREANDTAYAERTKKEQEEADKLQKEIEELEKQKSTKAELDRIEAQKLADAKLLEIQKLKEEHDARLKLFQEKLDFEELQKSRLLEEVEHLKKIRELREEKARLAAEVNRTAEFEDIQHLIDNRELEIAKLTKRIELDDNDLSKFHNKEIVPVTAEATPIESSAVSKGVEEPKKKKLTKLFDTPKEKVAAGVAAGAAAGAVAGTAVASSSSNVKSAVPTSTTSSQESPSSISRLKSLGKRLSTSRRKSQSPPKETNVPTSSTPKAEEDSSLKAIPVDVSKQPAAADSKNAVDDDYETYSVYEEVDSLEYEKNKSNPDYLIVSDEEYQKHRTKD